jgi:Fe-S oxidoreductase
MGLIQRWSRLAAFAPGLANFLTQTPGLSAAAKLLGGLAQARRIPRFAKRTFRQWFSRRAPRPQAECRRRVILWADTFNNHFHPAAAAAAVEVLEAAGCEVVVPRQALCCGRPLYDFGMLDLAKQQLCQIMEVLEPEIRAGIPIVGLEPGCVSVFRDELLNLFPDDELARRLSAQTFMFSDFLVSQTKWQPPRLNGKALVHGHCHQKALFGMDSDMQLLKKLGVEAALLDAGCCGMAGAFGFNPQHYELSIKAGETTLLPAVRRAAGDTMIVASGYSCREQIAQTTDRQALHIAEVAALALHRHRTAAATAQ